MDKYKKLETITNGINAAHKIRSLQNSTSYQRADGKPDTLTLLSEMLSVIAQHSPETHRSSLSERLDKTNVYGEAYRGLKQHVKGIKSNDRIEKNDIIKTLHIIKPVVDERKQTLIEKILKIQEILDS